MMLGGDGDLMSIVRSCGSTTAAPVTPPPPSLRPLVSGTTAFFQSSALPTWSTSSFLPPESLATQMALVGTVGGDRFMSGTEAFFHSSILVSNGSALGPTAATAPAEPPKKQPPRRQRPRAAAVAAPSRKRKEKEERVVATSAGSPVPGDDEFRWRKYGEKLLKGSHISRSYYKCRNCDSAGCPAKKKVDTRDDEPGKCTIAYIGDHNHKPWSVLAITPGKKIKIEVDDDYPHASSPISVLNTDKLSPGTTAPTVLLPSTVKEAAEIDGLSPVMPLSACPSTMKKKETQKKPERMLTVDDIEKAGDDNLMFLGQSFASKVYSMEVAAKEVDSAAKDCFPANNESSSTWAWLEEIEKRLLDDDEEKVTSSYSDLFQLQDDFSWC